MDFGSLLYKAQKNEKTANKEVKCYKTKFEPPKKEVKSKANLSANIQKYLQKREEEERKRNEEEKRKKEELLALRSQDRKAFKRVQTMLKRTKSANKSVMEDAIDDVNTAVTMAGPQQCDEDDYGYVSQEASAFYAKLMDKYASMPPDEPKFPEGKKQTVKDLNAAKDRVRAALQREEEEEMMPHKRKRKSKLDKQGEEIDEDGYEEKRERSREPSPVEEKPKFKKPKKIAPPPMDFSSLLKLAEQKQFEPIVIEKKVSEEDVERPMTKRQKLEYERERESRERRKEREALRNGKKLPDSINRIPKLSDSIPNREKPSGFGRIPKKSDTNSSQSKSETEDIRRKNSVDSDNDQARKTYNPIGDNSRNYKVDNDHSKKNNFSDKCDRSKSKFELEGGYSKHTDRKSEFSQQIVNRKSEKTHQPSIASNKIKSRNHNISEDETSEVSDSEHNKSNADYNEYRKHINANKVGNSTKEKLLKPSQNPNRNIASERNGYHERKYFVTDNEFSDSQSGSDSKKYIPSKVNVGSTNHKYKPEVKYKYEKERYSSSQKPPPYRSKHDGADESDHERSCSPDDSNYKKRRRQSYSDSEPEYDDRCKPPVKKGVSYSKQPQRNRFDRSDDDRSSSPNGNLCDKKHKNSSSHRDSETKNHHLKQNFTSANKVKKITSLFEGSDEDDYSNHDNMHKMDERKKPKPQFSETHRYSASESDFKIPKSNSKSDSEKPKVAEKYRQSENLKSSMNSFKPTAQKDRSKYASEIPRNDRSNTVVKENTIKPQLSVEKRSSIEKQPSKEKRPSFEKISSAEKRTSLEKHSLIEQHKDKSKTPKESSKQESSKENIKTISPRSAEEMLKKSSSVWSKPCNLSPAPSSAKPLNSLSQSQLERLRQMNKKPAPSKPPQDRCSTGSSMSGKPNPRDEKTSDGRPLPQKLNSSLQGKSTLLQRAVAERAAMVKSQMTSSRNVEPERQDLQKISDRQSTSKPSPTSSTKHKEVPVKDTRPKQFPPSDMRPKQFPPSDLKPRQFPPNDLKPRQFPPKDVRGRQFPPTDVKRKPKPRRIEDDSEEEYDSEMDDFIDDSEELNQEQISKEIQSIFGYDKSRYAGIDDDDECMESNFGQIDKEELRSLRIGAKEDYEELMKELAAKQRAKQRKKMMMNKDR